MKRLLCIALIAVMLAAMLVLVPSGTVVAEIVTYDIKDRKVLAPYKDHYISDTEYEDESISVRIERGRFLETNYVVAYVKIANASQLRTEMANGYWNPGTLRPEEMTKRVNALIAINGDFFSSRNDRGYVMRQGKEYRNKCDGKSDVLLIDENGDLHIIQKATKDDMKSLDFVPVNGFTFGPALIMNGERVTDSFPNEEGSPDRPAQRSAICQIGPLEYMLITTEGPEDPPDCHGLVVEEFADLLCTFDNIQCAYNLDGGSSAYIVFKNKKVNCPNNPKRRSLCDIIYFGTAYKPD